MPDLWKDSNAATVALLQGNKFDEVARGVPSKVSELLDCEPIESLIRHAGQKTVQMYLEAELIKLAGNFNGNPALNLKDYQVPVIAEQLIENYKWESIEDFTLCFRRASSGMYGEIYRIDGAVIGQWFARYLDEKYDALEQRQKKAKTEKEPRINEVVDGSKYIAQMLENLGVPNEREKDNSKENAYQRHKLDNPYPVTPPEIVQAKMLHIEYLREMNASGKKPEHWENETEWLRKRDKK